MMRAGGGPGGFSIAVVLTAVMGLVLVLALIVVLLAGYRIARSNTAELIREKLFRHLVETRTPSI